MQTHEFMGQVQHKARLATLDDAMAATRATLETLAERLGADEARHLGDQLPNEVANYLKEPSGFCRYSSDEFLAKVSEREGCDLPASAHHVRAVFDVLREAVSYGELRDVVGRLPDDYRRLFIGSEGRMPSA